VILASYKHKNKKLIGIFNVGKSLGEVCVDAADGEYTNLADGTVVIVKQGNILLKNKIIIFEIL